MGFWKVFIASGTYPVGFRGSVDSISTPGLFSFPLYYGSSVMFINLFESSGGISGIPAMIYMAKRSTRIL